ncbi:YycH family regulatory protein [Bacillus sinesaloumensis]|uniref:YycH family regulatory protein n=1 Tax=Litchfieldia sinesaloumensis TaxID=1926280 RepID=UPI00098853B6|nr:two-component system activity regulator YycH [Bacillus sinesaloumensis]
MIGMKYETIKTTVLIVLVLSSIILTWTLWTYQPQYKDLLGTDDLVEEVTTNNTKETQRIIRPNKILYHIDGQHFGTFKETELNKVMKELRYWEVNDVQNITHQVQDQGLANFLSQSGHVEIKFPNPIPLQLYKSFLSINDKDHSLLTFDRLVVDVNSENHGEGNVYFVSTGENLVYEGHVSSGFIKEFKRSFYTTAVRYPEQIEYTLTDTDSLYLPKDVTTTNSYEYLIDVIGIDTFIERLFTNASRVKRDDLTTATVHTDGTRLLRVYHNQNYIQFLNPTRVSGNSSETTDLIQTSIDYVNEHVGWTDDYRFFSWNKENQTTVFKLYIDNIPVFSSSRISDIIQQWENNDIASYLHPSISLNIKYETVETILPKGERVMETITSKQNFNPELLESVTIAYELREREDNSQLVSLQPIWMYRYNGSWIKAEIRDEDAGGNRDGLE